MLGRGRLDALRCLLRACSHLSSPLDLQRSSPPVRSFLLDRLACVGLTSRVHIVGARAPLHCRPFAASAADGEDAARHAGEALDEKLREPTQPDRLQRSDLSGSLLTAEERAEVYAEQSELQKARCPRACPPLTTFKLPIWPPSGPFSTYLPSCNLSGRLKQNGHRMHSRRLAPAKRIRNGWASKW